MQNKPCFTCVSAFLQNPWGILIVSLCLFFLCCTAAFTCRNYSRYSQYESDSIHASEFAEQRKRSLTSDSSVTTLVTQDFRHRMRHDYACGGIFCSLRGDPFGTA